MLLLSEKQWSQLQARDTQTFVDAVCEQYLGTHQASTTDTERQRIAATMQAAYDFAVHAGFTSTPHIVHLMYFAADAPGVLDEPAVKAQLSKPGATPEQRFDDLLAVVAHELNRLEEEK